jgi:hypothetical protein
MNQMRNVALIIAITAAMAIITTIFAFLVDQIAMVSTRLTAMAPFSIKHSLPVIDMYGVSL